MEVLRPHPIQYKLWTEERRFKVVACGRRSGKTEIAKRKLILSALKGTTNVRANFFAGAPSRSQAKRIYWDDLKHYTKGLTANISETDLCLEFHNGSRIYVLGMDKPERVEGTPWDGGVLDEYANMRANVWGEHVRPALSDRLGWCWFIGVPEGRNHYYDLYRYAQSGESDEWGVYTWVSADILAPSEVEAARRDLDDYTFQQEYEGAFVNFSGLAYYNFREALHVRHCKYDPERPLILCFDFNVDPGVAAVVQELDMVDEVTGRQIENESITSVIGEVFIDKNSNTNLVCNKIVIDWGRHEKNVFVYGDATGGSRGSARIMGSDWDLVKQYLEPVFGDRLFMRVPPANPKERSRVNAMNSRLKTTTGAVHLQVNPITAPHVVRDFEGVSLIPGGSGELNKKFDLTLTHITDALGYYVVREFPASGVTNRRVRLSGF